jgi:hypothetical protein
VRFRLDDRASRRQWPRFKMGKFCDETRRQGNQGLASRKSLLQIAGMKYGYGSLPATIFVQGRSKTRPVRRGKGRPVVHMGDRELSGRSVDRRKQAQFRDSHKTLDNFDFNFNKK